MHKNLLSYLEVMVSAGISIDVAISRLSDEYKTHKRLSQAKYVLLSGSTISEAFSHLFPWWCYYPFLGIDAQINSLDFIKACNSYIEDRKLILNNIIQVLSYPFFLFCFSILILILSFNLLHNTSEFIFRLYLALILIFFVVSFIFLVFFYVSFKQNPYDILLVIYLGGQQGWSYKSLISLGIFKKKGIDSNLFHYKLCQKRSFIKTFDCYFKLPPPIKDALLFYESSGYLIIGLQHILPIYKEYSSSIFTKICLFFKFFIYFYIVGLIFFLFFVVYKPMFNFV